MWEARKGNFYVYEHGDGEGGLEEGEVRKSGSGGRGRGRWRMEGGTAVGDEGESQGFG